MNSSPISAAQAAAPDESRQAQELIELGLALDPEARSVALARLIAAAIHPGTGSALQVFASSGFLEQNDMLDELNHVQVPLEQEAWIDALGRFILLHRSRRGERS